MKTRFFIEVDVDTDQVDIEPIELRKGEAKELVKLPTCARRVSPDNFIIYLRGDIKQRLDGDTEVAVLAHELGHIIASQFNLPGNSLDPRMKRPVNPFAFSAEMMASEIEAWDVAEMMFNIRSTRRQALMTYSKMFNMET